MGMMQSYSGCLPGTLVQSMVRNLEKQLEAPAKKPAGGVSLFSVLTDVIEHEHATVKL